ncbi:hypothetical protein AAE02nite_27190 [Adhaeribacter aerolatus]|uniref:Outer membrane protein beta-barrel domain-containing protein n=1 Tax=Adhaeribacter aerolatus TaxID=670289 RepID=A0A512AZB5_9BACT|nr:outer membrane beta-barrel protein [Adhaeribacter aerolatus]GEO05055.1 hypothetical protein AAE02nite_27190 [Adhaeribacter aerolatus]
MKKHFTLVLTACCFFFSLALFAQKPKIGIRVGSNYTNFIGENAKELNLENIWGGHGGLNITLPVYKNNISLKSDIIYSTKGAASANDSLKINLGYLDVPLLGQITAGPFYLEAGPQMSFLVNDTFKDKSGKTNAETMLNSFRRTSLCFALGAGTYIPVLGLTLGIRYNGDFSNLVNNLEDKAFRNSLFMFTTSFTLPTKTF